MLTASSLGHWPKSRGRHDASGWERSASQFSKPPPAVFSNCPSPNIERGNSRPWSTGSPHQKLLFHDRARSLQCFHGTNNFGGTSEWYQRLVPALNRKNLGAQKKQGGRKHLRPNQSRTDLTAHTVWLNRQQKKTKEGPALPCHAWPSLKGRSQNKNLSGCKKH